MGVSPVSLTVLPLFWFIILSAAPKLNLSEINFL